MEKIQVLDKQFKLYMPETEIQSIVKRMADCDEKTIESLFSVTGLRTWRELRGIPSIDLQRPTSQRSIMHSRTFAYMTDKKEELEQWVRTFATACAAELRKQKSVCHTVTVFLSTNRHRHHDRNN